MTPEEARSEIEEISRQIGYEQNLQKKCAYQKEYGTMKASEKYELKLQEEIKVLRTFL